MSCYSRKYSWYIFNNEENDIKNILYNQPKNGNLVFSSYKVPKFYTSNRIVPAVTKQDEDIFDFTDSRLIKPPAENVQNYPLVVEKVINNWIQ